MFMTDYIKHPICGVDQQDHARLAFNFTFASNSHYAKTIIK